jgi:hypothetical protein
LEIAGPERAKFPNTSEPEKQHEIMVREKVIDSVHDVMIQLVVKPFAAASMGRVGIIVPERAKFPVTSEPINKGEIIIKE